MQLKNKKMLLIVTGMLLMLYSCKEQRKLEQEQELLQRSRDSLQECLDSIRCQKQENTYYHDKLFNEPYPMIFESQMEDK